jgi:ADP-ribose pyrophosphatase
MKKVIPEDAVLVPDNAELKFKGMIFDVYQWHQKLFDGSEQTFEMLKRCDTVSIIGLVDNKIIIIDDEQPYLGERKSFPGGRVDDSDATILAAAQREMAEETGYEFANWRLVEVRQPYRKSEWFVYVWLAWDSTGQQERHLDAGEKIIVSQLDFEDLKTLIDEDIDYLGNARPLLKNINGLDQLMTLPEFSGPEVDR